MRLYLTGRSILTPLEATGLSTYRAILAGHGLCDQGIVPEELLHPPTAAASAARVLGDGAMEKSIRMGLVAALRAIRGSGWSAAMLQDAGTGIFLGTSKGPIVSWLAAADELSNTGRVSTALAGQIVGGPGVMGGVIAGALGVTGAAHTSVAACSSGMHALHRAARAVAHGECERALVVAADASIHRLFEASFARLGVLAPVDADGHRRCRPFDATGAGFFLTEAAAALTLEGKPGEGAVELLHTWIGADGTHLLAMDPKSRGLLAGVGTAAREKLAFIHAHATGTAQDAYELAALRGAVGDPAVPVFSHKRWLGHSLGAAGLAGVVLSADCHAHGMTLEGEAIGTGTRSLTVSQGFGGHIGLAVLRG